MKMNKEIRLTATNVFTIAPLEPLAPGPQEKTIRLTATNVFPIKPLEKNNQRPQIRSDKPAFFQGGVSIPDHIFKGSMEEFLDTAIVKANNGEDEPDRAPLDTCPDLRPKVCGVCCWYDVHVGCMSGNGDG